MNGRRKRSKAIPQGRKISLSLNRACQIGEEAAAQITQLSAVTTAAGDIVTTVDLAKKNLEDARTLILLSMIDTTDEIVENHVILEEDADTVEKEAEIDQIATDHLDATDAVIVEIDTDAMIGISSQNAKMFMKLFTLTFRKIRKKPVPTAKCLLMLRVMNFSGMASSGSPATGSVSHSILDKLLLKTKFKILLARALRTTSKWWQIVAQSSLITFL